MLFQLVPGQKKIKETLSQNLKNKKIPHALLLEDPLSYGGLALAIGYAQNMLCANNQEQAACGSCEHCRLSTELKHPDLHFVFPVNTNKEIKKNASSEDFLPAFRSFVLEHPFANYALWASYIDIEKKRGTISGLDLSKLFEKLSLKAFLSTQKIVVMWLPEKMTPTTGAKILKTLEEPLKDTYFILVSVQPSQLLKTILSRVQKLELKPAASDQIDAYLKTIGTQDTLREEACGYAKGSVGNALAFLKKDTDGFLDFFLEWLRFCFNIHKNNNISKAIGWIDAFTLLTKEKQIAFCAFTVQIIRQCTYLNYNLSTLTHLKPGEKEKLEKLSPYINHLNIDVFEKEFKELEYYVQRNANMKIALLDLSFKIAKFIRIKA